MDKIKLIYNIDFNQNYYRNTVLLYESIVHKRRDWADKSGRNLIPIYFVSHQVELEASLKNDHLPTIKILDHSLREMHKHNCRTVTWAHFLIFQL